MIKKKKIAIFFPYFIKGGSDMVVVWAIEALKNKYDISLFTYDNYEKLGEFNNFFGTNILEDDIKIINPPFSFLGRNIFGFGLLKYHLLVRYFKKQINDDFDILFGMYKEVDFGKKGIQYIHVPELSDQDQKKSKSVIKYYRNSFLGNIYRKICYSISDFDRERMKKNITLANSNWTKKIVKKTLGVESRVVYPPVVGNFPNISFSKRDNSFLCLGRIVREKEIEKVLRIIEGIRKINPKICLNIVGEGDNFQYVDNIKKLCGERGKWCSFIRGISGNEKYDFIARHKYGISGCVNEAFGIATAEMIKSGCIVFIPDGGGQVEIINDKRLAYKDENDAADKILKVLRDKNLQEEIKSHLADQEKLFSLDRFRGEILKIIENFKRDHGKAKS